MQPTSNSSIAGGSVLGEPSAVAQRAQANSIIEINDRLLLISGSLANAEARINSVVGSLYGHAAASTMTDAPAATDTASLVEDIASTVMRIEAEIARL